MSQPDDAQWIRIEFYARLPDGQAMAGVDPPEVHATLKQAFGFTDTEGLTVTVRRPPGKAPRCPRNHRKLGRDWPMDRHLEHGNYACPGILLDGTACGNTSP